MLEHLHVWTVTHRMHSQHLCALNGATSAAHHGSIVLAPAGFSLCLYLAPNGWLSCRCWWHPAPCWLLPHHLWGRLRAALCLCRVPYMSYRLPSAGCHLLGQMAQTELHSPGVPTCSSHSAAWPLQALLQLLVAACLMLLVVGQAGDLPPVQARSPNSQYRTGENEPYAPRNVAVTLSHGISFKPDPNAGEHCTPLL